MRTDYVYFKALNARIGTCAHVVNFIENEVINGEVYNLLPAEVSPKNELIKSADRSLDGTMNIDITGVKISLALTFDYLEDKDFRLVTDIFDLMQQSEKYPDGITVEYFDIKDSGAKKRINCYIDDLSYTPFIVDDKIAWRDVAVSLVEI